MGKYIAFDGTSFLTMEALINYENKKWKEYKEKRREVKKEDQKIKELEDKLVEVSREADKLNKKMTIKRDEYIKARREYQNILVELGKLRTDYYSLTKIKTPKENSKTITLDDISNIFREYQMVFDSI